MTVADVKSILDAEVVSGEAYLDREVHTACGSDMMSDVLAFVKDQSVLLTGLVNLQVVRTADMMDMVCIVFVRGKEPSGAMIELAGERGMVLMKTKERMFTACGKLYESGLKGGEVSHG
ncbi:DRTGG domain-containing protein [Candidatus Soleaferrea massiliensis]|uniref:DRTGG domain-containing protein n=1 Tax=Candidatus Soleaferrea massiliensis TaxID=1470354 RepID=UPI00058D35F2|nr:DRTGG domain-containing protein [Candidatus Soleaferrea massiliensis]